MLDLFTDRFNYNPNAKVFIADASMLGLPAKDWNGAMPDPVEKKIILTNPETYGSMMFEFDHVDMSPENEVGGWNYKNEGAGIDIIIIND